VATKVLNGIVGQMVGGAAVNLADTAALTTILNNAANAVSSGSSINSDFVSILQNANQRIIEAGSLNKLYEVQQIVQSTLVNMSGDASQLAASVVAINTIFEAAKGGLQVMDITLASGSDTGSSSTDRITLKANPDFKILLSSVDNVNIGANTAGTGAFTTLMTTSSADHKWQWQTWRYEPLAGSR
jgi:hypothetical protein